MTSTITQNSWLWVTGPDRLTDHTGHELPAVTPGAQVRGRNWWGCDRGTRAGDRALLCTMWGPSSVAYLVDVLSDARTPRPWEGTDPRWPSVCDYLVVERFEVAALTDQPEFRRWRAMPQVRYGGAFPISDAAWWALRGHAPA